MFVVRNKILVILISCAIIILLISSYYKNGNLRVKTCAKCQRKAHKGVSKAMHYDYSYETFNKDNFYDDKDEIKEELQNYNVINEIEYIDFANSSEKINTRQIDQNIISLKHLLSVCIKAAKAGGIQLQSVRRNFDLKQIWNTKPANKSDNPISVGRKLSHKAMAYTLMKHYPNIKYVSRKNNGYNIDPYDETFRTHHTADDVLVPKKNILIWFDPLDPEHEYNHNYLEYVTTMICVAVKGKPVIGVIHQPFENFTKWGWVGHGVSGDPYPMASEPGDVSKPLQVVMPTNNAAYFKTVVKKTYGAYIEAFAVNGAGYQVMQLLDKRVAGYLRPYSVKKWSVCGGDAIIRASGGEMKTLNNKKIDYGDPTLYTVERGLKASIEDPHLLNFLGSLESRI